MRTQSPNLKWTTKRLITQRFRKSDLFKSVGLFLAPNRTKCSSPTIDRSSSPYREVGESLLNRDCERHFDHYGFESRPIHTCALDGELTTVGSSPDADCCLDIQGWSPVQLALIQEQSGAALLDVASQPQLRLRGKSCRRWASHESTLLRWGPPPAVGG